MLTDILTSSTVMGVVISLIAFEIGLLIKKKLKVAIFNPLLIAIILTIAFLLVFNIEYDTYNKSATYLNYLLTPATVSLSVPLYLKLKQLKENIVPILGGIIAGSLTSVVCIFLIGLIFNLDHSAYMTLLPKSITTAIGMPVAEAGGGVASIAAAVIIMTGIMGNMTAPFVCKLVKIKSPISRGIAIGTSSHAIGTAKATEMGETEGAMSGLAIAVAGVTTVILIQVFSMFI